LGNPDFGKERTAFMVNKQKANIDTELNDKDEIYLLSVLGGG
jgi:sulfur carrier protein ThiS